MFSKSTEGDRTVLAITAETIEAANAGKLKEAFARLGLPGDAQVTLDLARVRFIDSSGVGAILTLYKQLGAKADAVVLRKPAPAVQSVFELLRLHRVFKIEG